MGAIWDLWSAEMAAFKLNYMLESNNVTFNSFAQFQSLLEM